MKDSERQAALDAIAAEVAVCTHCRLHVGRTKSVPGEGTPATEVMFVGEGPGYNEDQQGRPFVGRAGGLLDELLESVAWRRPEVYITNVVKCRPPDNRDPEPDEIAACAPFLVRQLAALEPALVVTLGRFSMAHFMPAARIGQVHGTFRAADPSSGAGDVFAFAMYHPAAALRQTALRETLFTDMRGVPAALTAARARQAEVRATIMEPAPEPASILEPELEADSRSTVIDEPSAMEMLPGTPETIAAVAASAVEAKTEPAALVDATADEVITADQIAATPVAIEPATYQWQADPSSGPDDSAAPDPDPTMQLSLF